MRTTSQSFQTWAVRWAGALTLLLALWGGATTQPATAQQHATKPDVAAQPTNAIGCHVSYTVAAQTGTIFLAEPVIYNTGTTPINGWALSWSYSGNQQVSTLRASYTQTGNQVTAYNPIWAPTIPVGGSFMFIVQGTYSGANINPTSFILNGVPCT